MKSAILLYLLLSLNLTQESLNGKYKMEYEEQYSSSNGIINFNTSTYQRKLSSGRLINGSISYKGIKIILKDENADIKVEFYKDELQKDTIYFRTSKIDEISEDGDIMIFSGKLIKIK